MKTVLAVLMAGLAAAFLLPGCGNPGLDGGSVGGNGAATVVLRAALPPELAAWRGQLGWRIRGSLLAGTGASGQVLPAGGELRLKVGGLSARGDWLLGQACLKGAGGDWLPSGLADIGWTSASGLPELSDGKGGSWLCPALDRPAGLAAGLLESCERAGGNWSGLNLRRLDGEIRQRGLDSLDLETGTTGLALARHQFSVLDLAARPLGIVDCEVPPGEWLDGRGQACAPGPAGTGAGQAVRFPGCSWLRLRLPPGAAWLYRRDGGAWLVLTVWQAGDGQWRALAAEHRLR